jgi:hypothetical protein
MRRQRLDGAGLGPLRHQVSDLPLETLDAARRLLDRSEVLFEADVLTGMIELLLPDPGQVSLRPPRLAWA